MSNTVLPLLAVLALGGCGPSFMVQRPKDAGLDADITQLWAHEIRAVAEPGDWLLSRSYSAIGDAITVASADIFSHSAVYDPATDEVIEAVNGHGVRAVPLEVFLHRNSLVVLVRPRGLSAEVRRASLARARSRIGASYDAGGLVGMDDPDAFYCSELNAWAVDGTGAGADLGDVVTPGELMELGDPIYVARRDAGAEQQRALAYGARSRTRRLSAMLDAQGRLVRVAKAQADRVLASR